MGARVRWKERNTSQPSGLLQSQPCSAHEIEGDLREGASFCRPAQNRGGPVFAHLEDDQPQVLGTIPAYKPNRQRGDTLPGLLQAHDVAALQTTVTKIKTVDEERRKRAAREKKYPSQRKDPGA